MQAAVAADGGPINRSKTLDDSLARAHQLAVAQGHAVVTLEHLLFSLQDDPDSQAILDLSGVGRDKLAADVSSYVGRLSEMMPAAAGVAPQPGPDLLRILQLAAMAARQSQRRVIDGAIVLAAIIGDGNSPAAGMLKAQGLTFEAVIKALSQIGQPRQQGVAAEASRATLPPPDAVAQAGLAQGAIAQGAATQGGSGPSPAAQAREAVRVARAAEAPSADAMLASVRERVKRAEPATVPIKTAPKPEPRPDVPDVNVVERPEPPAADGDVPQPVPQPGAADAAPPPPRAQPPMPRGVPAAVPPLPTAERPGPALAEMRRPQMPAHVPPAPSSAAPSGLPPPLATGHGSARPPLPPAAMPPAVPNEPPRPPQPSAHFAPPPMPPQPMQPQPMAMPPPPAPAAVRPAPPAPPPSPAPYAPPPQAAAPPSIVHPANKQPPLLLNPAENLNIVAAAAGLPASMRMGTPVLVEVRIPRDQIDVPRRRGPQGLGAVDTPIYRVVSVRLGTGGVSGLAIEPRSPETVWLGMGRDLDQHDFVWQFVVTPTRAGRFAVTLGVSGRTVSPFGVAGDGTPMTETFAVVVKRPPGGRFKRFMTWVSLFALGATAMALAGGPLIAAAKLLAARLLK